MEVLKDIVGKVLLQSLQEPYIWAQHILAVMKQEIVDAAKTVMVVGPGGNAVAAEIISGDIEPSLQQWLDYTPYEVSYEKQ